MKGFAIRLETAGFGADPANFAEFVRQGLQALTMANLWAYRNDPTLPGIYEAGVVYRREPPGYEQFADVATVLRRKHGDCEDLSCALAAWRTVRTGELCRPNITWQPRSEGGWLYHITVSRADGSREDPSRKLGMNAEPGRWTQQAHEWKYVLFPGRTGLVPDSVPLLERQRK